MEKPQKKFYHTNHKRLWDYLANNPTMLHKHVPFELWGWKPIQNYCQACQALYEQTEHYLDVPFKCTAELSKNCPLVWPILPENPRAIKFDLRIIITPEDPVCIRSYFGVYRSLVRRTREFLDQGFDRQYQYDYEELQTQLSKYAEFIRDLSVKSSWRNYSI